MNRFCNLSPDEDHIEEACKTVDRRLRNSDSGLFDLIAAKADIPLIQQYFEACVQAGPIFEKVFRDESLSITAALAKVEEANDRIKDIQHLTSEQIKYKEMEMKAKEDSLLAELQRTIDEGRERMYKTIESKDATINGVQGHLKAIETHAQEVEAALRAHVASVENALAESNAHANSLASQIHVMQMNPVRRVARRLKAIYRSLNAPPTPQPLPGSSNVGPQVQSAQAPEVAQEDTSSLRSKPLEDLNELAKTVDRETYEAEIAKFEIAHTPQSLFGKSFLPQGSTRERFYRLFVGAKNIAQDEGRGAVYRRAFAKIGRKLTGRPAPQQIPVAVKPASDVLVPEPPSTDKSRAELIEVVRKDLLQTGLVAENYERSVTTMLEKGFNHGANYVPLDPSLTPPENPAVKLIAFYLTQFHPIPENDKWWGKGFTEWTNVSKAVPVYAGQYQPHLPDELGFYDLRVREIQERQVELAKMHGLHGFAFYYYWFAGKRLLERPLDNFVNNPNIDFPFCLIWANENWTRRWDGRQDDVLMAQDHSPEGDVRFIEDLRPYLEHPNYIRIGGRPLIIVYRASQLPDPKHTAERWRDYCLRNNLGNPIIVAAQTFGFENAETIGFDASMQFPPHNEHSGQQFQLDYRGERIHALDDKYSGCICSYPALVGFKHNERPKRDYPLYETAFPMWDNTPRLPLTGVSYTFSSPELYKIWLQKLCVRAVETEKKRDNRLVFINAWNEWAEGAHLEPDRRFGYGYLKATREALDFANRVEEGAANPASIALDPDEEMEGQLKDKPHSPILVYQMGKVGSRSIFEALREMNLPEPVLHLHLMHKIDIISKNVCLRYPHPEGTLFYLRRGQWVREWMERGDENTVYNVITGVREPVGRNVSSFFELLASMIPNLEKRYQADDISVEELHELFLHQYDQRSPNVWFDSQFKPVFDIDVFATPFPHENGYEIYEKGRSRVLLIRIEDLNRTVKQAMEEFLGMHDFPISTRNRSEDKIYHDLAVRFKQRPLPESYIDQMLSTPYALHFYTQEERDKVRKKWTRR